MGLTENRTRFSCGKFPNRPETNRGEYENLRDMLEQNLDPDTDENDTTEHFDLTLEQIAGMPPETDRKE